MSFLGYPPLHSASYFEDDPDDLYWQIPKQHYVPHILKSRIIDISLKGDVEQLRRRIHTIAGVNQIKLISFFIYTKQKSY